MKRYLFLALGVTGIILTVLTSSANRENIRSQCAWSDYCNSNPSVFETFTFVSWLGLLISLLGTFLFIRLLSSRTPTKVENMKNVPASTADEISKLAALLASGALSEEEFQAAKKRLL